MTWSRVRLDWLTEVSREVIDPRLLGDDAVVHYSIPALDALGGPAVEPASSIASTKLRVHGGEVLISKLNPRKLRVVIVRSHDNPAMASGEFIALRPKSIEPKFLGYWLQSERTRQDLDGATQSVTRSHQRVTPDVLTKKWLTVPGLAEQRAIADYLDTETARIDALIAKKQRLMAAVEERFWSTLEDLVVPTALEGLADSGRRPWPTTALKRLAEFFTDGDWIEAPFIVDEGIRLIQTGNIGRGEFLDKGGRYITTDTFHELRCTPVLPGDVLISRLAGTIGQACIAPEFKGGAVTSVDVVIMRTRPDLLPEFLVAYLSSARHLGIAELEARGTTMMRLARSQVGELPAPHPPLGVQHLIVERLNSLREETTAITSKLLRQIELLREHRQALITAAVTGELEVPGVAA